MPNYNNPYGNNPYGMNYPNYGYPYNNFGNNGMPQNNNQAQPNQQAQLNQYAFVNGIEGAKSFQMQPNQSILLMDSDGPLCYMKSSNNVGQSSLRYFKLVEVSEAELRTPTQPQVNTSEYVLKADFEALSKKVDSLLARTEKPYKKENKGE